MKTIFILILTIMVSACSTLGTGPTRAGKIDKMVSTSEIRAKFGAPMTSALLTNHQEARQQWHKWTHTIDNNLPIADSLWVYKTYHVTAIGSRAITTVLLVNKQQVVKRFFESNKM